MKICLAAGRRACVSLAYDETTIVILTTIYELLHVTSAKSREFRTVHDIGVLNYPYNTNHSTDSVAQLRSGVSVFTSRFHTKTRATNYMIGNR